MKNFNYHSAKDSKEASKLSSSNSAFLAGGMTTIPSMKLGLASYKDVIDIKNINSHVDLQDDLDSPTAKAWLEAFNIKMKKPSQILAQNQNLL